MLASSRWLLDYLPEAGNFDAALSRLTRAGVSVESVKAAGEGISKVVVGQLLEVAKHPQADRLSLTKVSIGSETFQVVCGAKNIAPGQKVPLALVGASLPGLPRLEKAKIRGVESFGMMCSAKELGLADIAEGIYLLPDDAPVGADLNDYLGLPDILFEVEITPNRADLLSHFGLARELGSLLGQSPSFPLQPALVESGADASSKASLSVEDTEGCPFYSGRVIEGVVPGPSPRWLCDRLERLGHRSINNVVDVTNYVLFELGQPLHAFDLDLLEGHRIVVRRALTGEAIPLLDGSTRELTGEALVIADAKKPVALAGIMGGGNTMVTEKTRNILLESARFHPGLVRRTSRRLGISTDSSYRFERGVDPSMVRKALDRAGALIRQCAGGEIRRGTLLASVESPPTAEITFRMDRCSRILGSAILPDVQVAILKALGCSVKESKGSARVVPPTWRMDLSQEIDLVEEVARIYGYDRIPAAGPAIPLVSSGLAEIQRPVSRARRAFQRRGLTEAVNVTFLPPDFAEHLRLPEGHPARKAPVLSNPLAEDQKVMRPTLIPSLLANVRLNLSHQMPGSAFFEIGKVFLSSPDQGVSEHVQGACVLAGSAPGSGWHTRARETDFYDLKGVAEDLLGDLLPGVPLAWEYGLEGAPFAKGVSLRARLADGRVVLWGGALDPKVKKAYDISVDCFAFESDLETIWEASPKETTAKPLPKFPSARRDVALVVPEGCTAAEIGEAMRSVGGEHLVDVSLFDLYQGGNLPPGHRSLAWSLVFQAAEKTLTDTEVNQRVSEIVKTLQARYAVALR